MLTDLGEPQAGDAAAEPEARGGGGVVVRERAVEGEIDEDPHVAPACLLHQRGKVVFGPVRRVKGQSCAGGCRPRRTGSFKREGRKYERIHA